MTCILKFIDKIRPRSRTFTASFKMASKEVERKPAQKKSRFKTIRVFLVFYTLARLCVQAAYTYSSGVNTTIERNFGFSSRMIGTFSVVKEIITIACIALQIVFGGRIHVPILMGVGVAMCGPASLLHALPYLIYGKPTDTPHPGTNQTGSEFCAWRNMTEDCNGRDGSLATPTVVAYVIFLVNNFVAGISSSSMAILFVPYIHLNAKNSKESAFLIGNYDSSRIENDIQYRHFVSAPIDRTSVSAWLYNTRG